MLTLSSSAVLAWVFGWAILSGLTLRDRLPKGRSWNAVTATAIAGLGVGLGGLWWTIGPRLGPLDPWRGVSWSDPWPVWSEGAKLLGHVFWFGVGPGGFGDGVAASGATLPGRHMFVGNGYLQMLLDYGALLGLLAMVGLTVAVVRVSFRRSRKRNDLPLLRALLAASGALAFGVGTGFAGSIPGVFIPVVMLLGLMEGRDRRYRRYNKISWPPSPSPVERAVILAPMVGLGTVVVLATALTPSAWVGAHKTPEQTIRHLASTPAPLPEEVDQAARRALAHRPLQGRLHLMIGLAHRAAGDDALALAALRRADRFEPHDPAPTMLIARTLLEQGQKAQALETYRDALTRSTFTQGHGRKAIAAELARVLDTPDDLLSVIGLGDEPVWAVVFPSLLHRAKDPKSGAQKLLAVGKALWERNPSAHVGRLARLYTAHGHAMLGQYDEAKSLLKQLLVEENTPAGAYRITAELMMKEGALLEAIDVCQQGLKTHGQDVELQFLLAELLLDGQRLLPKASEARQWPEQ
ncbi:MAG: tetratricopeptide repeat protein, partial [Myxococcota bacterium]